ncbi:MAG: YaiI/YqxD family protein [Pseudomonadota bacterium]
MDIWVDADACPVVIKQLLYRAAQRTRTLMTLVANQSFQIPKSPYIKFLLVGAGFDVADNEIVKCLKPGDLVITSDIPLAALVMEKGGQALNPRGELYTTDTIRSRLYTRDVMENLRASGIETSGPSPLNQKDKQLFANHLDQLLVQAKKR